MSCEQSVIAEESSFEAFEELVFGNDSDEWEKIIFDCFFTGTMDEGKCIWDYIEHERAFSLFWKHDMEGMCGDMKRTIRHYCERSRK
jgi:hypothetical protein